AGATEKGEGEEREGGVTHGGFSGGGNLAGRTPIPRRIAGVNSRLHARFQAASAADQRGLPAWFFSGEVGGVDRRKGDLPAGGNREVMRSPQTARDQRPQWVGVQVKGPVANH